MGAVEEGGKAVTGIIETFKSQPMVLALVLMNLGLLALLYWTAEKQAALRSHDVEIMGEQQKMALDLLSRCVVPKAQSLYFSLPLKPLPFK